MYFVLIPPIYDINKRSYACNSVIYGELGRFPLCVMRYVKSFNNWIKIANSDNIIVSKVYQMSLAGCKRGKTNLVSFIKKTIL